PASRASPHLPQARDGAWEGHADRRIELADVDSELERIGRDHSEQLPLGEASLNLATLGRGIACTVRSDPLGKLAIEPVPGVAQDQLDALARLHEADRPAPALDQSGEDLRCFV